MTIGLLGKKCGMTRIYNEAGSAIGVTVLEVKPNRVTQLKTKEKEGYLAMQVTSGQINRSHLNKPETGHFAKAGVEPGKKLIEFRVENEKAMAGISVGSEITLDRFAVGQYVDVIAVTKGKGFAGVIKRHHFNAQDATHGNSLSHRAPGSIGQRQSPGKVFKGKLMAGQLGSKVRTILSQEIVHIDQTRQLIFIKGGVPGSPNGYVVIRPAVKKQD